MAEAKKKALDDVSRAETQWDELQSRVNIDGQTGEAKQLAQIDAACLKQIADIQKIGTAAGLTQQQIQTLTDKTVAGFQKQKDAVDTFAGKLGEAQTQTEILQNVGVEAANSFSSGMAGAFVAVADGSKSAAQAFGQFAEQFLEQIAQMIIQAEMLAMIKTLLGTGGTVTATSATAATGSSMAGMAADGGMFPHFAADGIQSVPSPTYFPKFNVVAGEQGPEMLTVLARPTFRSLGGMDAVVGNAGSRRLAITNADDLENRAGGGAGGLIHIRLEHTPETQATIIQNSIRGAVSQVTTELTRHSAISNAVKKLTA